MKSHPILFSAPMVRALLNGSKTQTRRVVKPAPKMVDDQWFFYRRDCPVYLSTSIAAIESCPYGQPGDQLWVREAWSHDAESLEQCRASFEDAMGPGSYGPYYRATESAPDTLRWKPSIHMPRWASRITLEITSVRVERLQDISGADARAEGAPPSHPSIDRVSREFGFKDFPRSWYAQLWDQINGPDTWAANPWVWVVEFKVAKPG